MEKEDQGENQQDATQVHFESINPHHTIGSSTLESNGDNINQESEIIHEKESPENTKNGNNLTHNDNNDKNSDSDTDSSSDEDARAGLHYPEDGDDKSDSSEDQGNRSVEKCEEIKAEASKYFLEKDITTALTKFNEALKACPKNEQSLRAKIFSNMSICFKKNNAWDDVVHYASQALDSDPDFIKPQANRGDAYMQLHKYEDALEDYKKVREIDPELVSKAKLDDCQKKYDADMEKKKTEVLGNLKDLGNKFQGNFGISLDNFKLNQNQDGTYNVAYGK